ncbi:F-box/kelch-repeat protein At3g23880-like [Vicia villosa]|uniref:F-box/kelch-repeat protein At3g23880-like n=1 Tax=Vicia villosa TaxID=3911 RepID=UPI00273B1F33|nr:F-box/kelch-repeat protein At3g23880-like [Vicia villosa]
MDYLPIKKRIQSNAPLPPPSPFIPDEIISEILCLLPVKILVQLKCVSKIWNTLISDPSFVQKHLKSSSLNPYLLFTPRKLKYPMGIVKFFPVLRLLETDSSITVSNDSFTGGMYNCQVVGICNGLICLFFHYHYRKYWFRLWNPATRTLSKKLGTFKDQKTVYDSRKFTFGCDISTGTYKVVASNKVKVREENTLSVRSQFTIFSLDDNCWRSFQYGSSIPVNLIYASNTERINNGLHLNGTVNWLALPKYIKPFYRYDCKSIANAQQFVIVSLDLSTETCTQFLLPSGFDEVPFFQPTHSVLMDCLCFSHDLKGSEFVIWQMKEFGVQKSWTLLFKINYFDIQMPNSLIHIGTSLLPLYLSKNGDTCILAGYEDDQVVIYNQREKRVKRIGVAIATELCWFSPMEYVESLVSTC